MTIAHELQELLVEQNITITPDLQELLASIAEHEQQLKANFDAAMALAERLGQDKHK